MLLSPSSSGFHLNDSCREHQAFHAVRSSQRNNNLITQSERRQIYNDTGTVSVAPAYIKLCQTDAEALS